MRKKILFILLVMLGSAFARTQAQKTRARKIDTVAVSILDKMSAMIGDLSSCSVTIKSNYDVQSKELGLVKHSDEEQLFLHGPDKLLIRSEGDKGSRDFIYDGKTLSYYSLDNNHYGQISIPASIMEMIDTVNKLYGIEFSGADFFYPDFVEDILSEAKELAYLGLTKVDGKECFHIAGKAGDKTFQFWISNDAYTLPLKMVIVYTSKEMSPQYEAEFTGWQVNPTLPDALFVFSAPPKAKQIKLKPLTAKK
ncbi:MAG TPA: DUF2092 domain-containing protein [Puia sp.]|nr:DUF2092 domain-containing protein [Puia sp.]